MDLGKGLVPGQTADSFSGLLHQLNRVGQQPRLDAVVDGADVVICHLTLFERPTRIEVNVETWMVVDFEDPRLEVSIDEQVKPKDLKRLALYVERAA